MSRYTVLPWEEAEEYDALLTAVMAEHDPEDPRRSISWKMVGIIWRKRRLRLAEAAAHRCGLDQTLTALFGRTATAAIAHLDSLGRSEGGLAEAVHATAAGTEEELRDLQDNEAMVRRTLDLLGSSRDDAYEAALAALREGTREWWAEVLARSPDDLDEDELPATADVDGLRRFVEEQFLPWFEGRKAELANRRLVREQAFGEAFAVDKLERLGRYEVHLDRKFERTVSMLLRLNELRQDTPAG